MSVSSVFLALFIICTIIFILVMTGGIPGSVKSIIYKAKPAPMSLRKFLRMKPKKLSSNQSFLFSEESVISLGHRFKGRFDQAVIRRREVPILELVVERKFPTKYLPSKIRMEDIFQASLYGLAIQESGASCSKTKIAVIYCIQENALNCTKNRNTSDCLSCDLGRVFTKKYNQKWVLKELERLDEIWFKSRTPIANPGDKCRACPYSKNGGCQYSIY